MASWGNLLVAILAVSVFKVYCDTRPEGPNGLTEDQSGSLFGFKPCLDEDCESYAPETPGAEVDDYNSHGTDTDKEYMEENPRVHCIMLKPSAVETFGEIEHMHPGISDIKYRVLEELIDQMYPFATLELCDCQPAMKLIDLIILAANSLKTQYLLQGAENCTYKESSKGEYVPDHGASEMPFHPELTESSDYVTPVSPLYPKSTEKPEIELPTEELCPPGSATEQPCYKYPVTKKSVHMPCPDGVTTELPCYPAGDSVTEEYSDSAEIEIVSEDEDYVHIPFVGSMRGIPGEHYPNYSEIPITSFSCADKKNIPGFYADLETGCQVFHVCYEHRRESFLCPIGTIFNQPILACDYWYSSNCSEAPHYYDVNEKTELKEEKIDVEVDELLTLISEKEMSEDHLSVESDLEKITPFFPVKAVVTDIKVPLKPIYPAEEVASEIVDEIATKVTKVISSTRDVIKTIPEPEVSVLKQIEVEPFPIYKKKPMKMEELLVKTAVPLKVKLAAIPLSKVTTMKTAVPVASLAAKKISIPVAAAKAKLASKVAAIPAIKAAVSVPLLAKTKIATAAVPAAKVFAKAKLTAIPAAKVAVAAPVIAKAKIAIPAAKVAVAAPVIVKTKIAMPAAKIAVAAPVVKAKVVVPAAKTVALKAAVPVVAKVAVKSSLPALKAKMVASAVPLAKSKLIPLMKAKAVKSASTPLLKAKMLALPLAKSKLAGPVPLAKIKLAKAAAISPLTKKALALGYMKLLKAKKVALMG